MTDPKIKASDVDTSNVTARSAFASDGPLVHHISGFAPRPSQSEMAVAVEQAIAKQQQLIVEAATGTGKTFAYLVPALLCGKKVLLSTGTKALQEQLFFRDLPIIQKALSVTPKVALLKGRSNYLCDFRLQEHLAHAPSFEPQFLAELAKVQMFAAETQTGDLAELTAIEEDAKVLPYVTSTADNCVGKECAFYQQCHLRKARLRAMEAEVVVINHHLFFADMALKDTGFGELVPQAEALIFDEAHQLPEIAAQYFGESLSSRQIIDLCKDVELEYRSKLTDMAQLQKAAERLQTAVLDWRLLFSSDPERGNWREKSEHAEQQRAVKRVQTELAFLYDVLKLALGRTEVADQCFERVSTVKALLARLCDIDKLGVSLWYETTPRHLTLHLTPLDIAAKFQQFITDSKAAFVFTSATLSVNGGFNHFALALGLSQQHSLVLDSPFDYPSQAMLCVPRFIPEAMSPKRTQYLVNLAQKLILANKGRCFFLFTSYRMMEQVAQQLADRTPYPILLQGTTSKRVLLEQFVAAGHAVLLGTASFWEGVDVRGQTLSCVIIDKLPFVAPDDPLLAAKMEDCRRRGGDPFAEIQLPQAVIALKQGVGRLIRDVSDQGALVICDDRLVNRHYGAVFAQSLPQMQKTRDINKVCAFLTSLQHG